MSTIIKGKNPQKLHTVRYWVGGKQREKSFATAREARDFKTKTDYEARTQSFVDPKLSSIRFADYVEQVISERGSSPNTRKTHRSVFHAWVEPWAGDRTLAQIAKDRERMSSLLNAEMTNADDELLSWSRRNSAYGLVTVVLNEAVRAGRISNHRLAGITVIPSVETSEHRDFVIPSFAELSQLQAALKPYGPVVWLMRGCGLRISEALAVHREDFLDHGETLRLVGQSSANGQSKAPLKHRKPGEYRDIPVPGYLWDLVKDRPRGPVCPRGNRHLDDYPHPTRVYWHYNAVYMAFVRNRDRIGITPDFTPHSLRHLFASVLLGNGVPITDVAEWLGHRDVSITYKIYRHLIPSAAGKARTVLDTEFSQWSRLVR